ncbi:MAG: PD-(D/E)XK nuclease family protein [Lachnospiraceae bacterium]|nr:PD-(D/E)XK nuclease family protein [Lachnospiraceae bacterium]
MALHMILGNAGDGKTHALYQKVLETSADAGRKLFLLVPEQASLSAQKELTAMHPRHCILNCDILSFRRLSFRLLEELGNRLPVILEDTGKGMMIKKLLLEHGEELTLYAGKERKKGFVGQVRSLLSELSQYCVTPEAMEEARQEMADPLLTHKFSDLIRIYRLFQDALADSYLTEEDLFSAMCPLVQESALLRGSHLFLDGYTGFTPSQYRLLEQLFLAADEVYVTLSIDPAELAPGRGGAPLFTLSRKTLAHLRELAERCGQPEAPPVCVSYGGGEPSLRHLKEQIFRYPAAASAEAPAITIRSLANRREEIRYLVSVIVRLVREEGYRYREIGILCGDVEGYSEELRQAFRRAGIPCFIDYKENVLGDPCVDLLRSVLRILATDFRRDAVAHYMKNPLSGFTLREAALMENYLLASGVRGRSAWSRPFVRTCQGRPAAELTEANALRERCMEDWQILFSGFGKDKTVREGLTALYYFLKQRDAAGQMERLADRMAGAEEGGSELPLRLRKEKEYRQIYPALISMFEQMEEILGNECLPVQEFADILDTGFEETKLGVIPPEPDSISVGDVKRSRLQQVRTLFFLGVNEGVVPGFSHAAGLFTDREREKIKAAGLELAETAKEAVATEEFYLYLAMAKPTEHLYLTYRRCGDDGRELRPSYVLHRIGRIFPSLTVSYGEEDSLFSRLAPDGGERLLLQAIGQRRRGVRTPEGEALQAYFSQREEPLFGSRMTAEKLFRASRGRQGGFALSERTAGELYSQTLRGSVSRMECFAQCAYRHFLQYGLRLSERSEFQVSAVDVGSLFHTALCLFSEDLKQAGLSWRTVAAEEARPRMLRAVREALLEQTTELFESSERNRYQLSRVEELLERTVLTVQEQLREGSFEPESFERRFTHADERLELNGIIDRIDVCREDGITYFKVVDYKSGEQKLDLSRVFDGVSLQLSVYLAEAERLFPDGAVPAAGLYYHIDDPLVDKLSDDRHRELRRALCPDGVVLEKKRALRLLDGGLVDGAGEYAKRYQSLVLPVATTAAGEPAKTSKLLSESGMWTVFSYVDWLLHRQAERILRGEIEPHPYRNGQRSACEYCPYRSVCGFDASLPSCTYRQGRTRSREEALAEMQKRMNGEANGENSDEGKANEGKADGKE